MATADHRRENEPGIFRIMGIMLLVIGMGCLSTAWVTYRHHKMQSAQDRYSMADSPAPRTATGATQPAGGEALQREQPVLSYGMAALGGFLIIDGIVLLFIARHKAAKALRERSEDRT